MTSKRPTTRLAFIEEFKFVLDASQLSAVIDEDGLTHRFFHWLVCECRGDLGHERGLIGFADKADLDSFTLRFAQ